MDNTLSASPQANTVNPYEVFVPQEELHQPIDWTITTDILVLTCLYVCYPLYYLWHFRLLWRNLELHWGLCSWCLQAFLVRQCYLSWNQDNFIILVRNIGMFFLQAFDASSNWY